MVRRAGGIGLALALAGCTQQIVLQDVQDGGPEVGTGNFRDGGEGSDPSCRPGSNTISYGQQPAQVLILFDRSSDMQKSFAGTTREQAAQNALSNAVSASTARIKFGFVDFPSDSMDSPCSQGSCCAGQVLPAPATYNASYVNASILCTGSGSRGSGCPAAGPDSPSHAALGTARDYYRSKPTDDDVYVLLVTSSEPSCSGDGRDACSSARNYAADLGDAKIRLIVVSVGYAPDPNSCLSQISQKGSLKLPQGIKSLYSVSNANDLNGAFTDIFTALERNACTLSSLFKPPGQAQLSVSIGADPIPQVDSPGPDGWSYANSDHTRLTFNGKACDEWLGATMYDKLYVSYPCSTCAGPNACYPTSTWP